HSVWMPRYLGIIWPALIIAVSVILLRIPTRAVRIGAISFIVAVNLALYSARVFAGTEPPVDRIAADVWAARPREGNHIRAYTSLSDSFGMGPGLGAMFSPSWRYYMVVQSGITTPPTEFRFLNRQFDRRFATYLDVRPAGIVYDLDHNPQIDHIV